MAWSRGYRNSRVCAPIDRGSLFNAVLAVELRGQRIGSETPRSLRFLSEHLDSLLPGIRLLERLSDIPDLDHQKIVNILAEGGSYARHHRPAGPDLSSFRPPQW